MLKAERATKLLKSTEISTESLMIYVLHDWARAWVVIICKSKANCVRSTVPSALKRHYAK